MSKTEQPESYQYQYRKVQPLLRHVRVMQRFFREVVGEHPNYRQDYSELHGAYMKILNEELAPHALALALAITELQHAQREIATE